MAANNKSSVRCVEYEPGWGWIARKPNGDDVVAGFRWRTREIARDVARQARPGYLEPYTTLRTGGEK